MGASIDDTPTRPVEPDIYRDIPLAMLGTINLYLLHGAHPGDGIAAVLQNDLRRAVSRWSFDEVSLKRLVMYLDNRVPASAWGSQERIEAWCALPLDVRERVVNDSAHAVYFRRRMEQGE